MNIGSGSAPTEISEIKHFQNTNFHLHFECARSLKNCKKFGPKPHFGNNYLRRFDSNLFIGIMAW